MKKPVLQVIEIAKINLDHGFRYVLNEARIEQLATLRDSGVELDPIEVVQRPKGRFDLNSGNHRTAEAKRRGDITIPALVFENMTTLEMVRRGIAANAGEDGKNPLPPTEDDLRMMIRKLLRADCTPAQIKATIPFPAGYVGRLLMNVQASELKRRKETAYGEMVQFNWTPKQAAEAHSLPVTSYIEFLERRKKGKNTLNFDTNNPHKNENAKLGNRIRGFTRAFSDISKAALRDVDENGRPLETVYKMLDHADGLVAKLQDSIKNVRHRAEKLAQQQ